jgi:hypothetical protein
LIARSQSRMARHRRPIPRFGGADIFAVIAKPPVTGSMPTRYALSCAQHRLHERFGPATVRR